MVKILFVLSPAFNPTNGGVQNTTFKLGREFSNRGNEVSYFSYTVSGHIHVEFGTLFHSLEKGGSNNSNNNSRLRDTIVSQLPDIVINQMPYEEGIQNALLSAKKTHPFVTLGCLRNSLFSVVNNLETYSQNSLPKALHFLSKNVFFQKMILARHKKRHAKSLKNILQNHDFFVLLVPTNIEELRYFLPSFDEKKIVAIPNSIPSIDDDWSKKEKVILHVGRLNFSQKRSDLIVPFWERLHKRLPEWTFEIVGYGEMESHVQTELERLNLPRVKFFGKQNPNTFYKRASLFMMPSAYEGFPNTLLEAQSYGCVSFCFDSYPALRWIIDNNDALLAAPFDLNDLVERMVEIANNNEKLQAQRTSSIKNASRFTIDKVADQWENLFKNILKK